jgi:hypothetical protein
LGIHEGAGMRAVYLGVPAPGPRGRLAPLRARQSGVVATDQCQQHSGSGMNCSRISLERTQMPQCILVATAIGCYRLVRGP